MAKKPTTDYRPGPTDRTVIDANGKVVPVPSHWKLLPPGDAAMTRRVKAAGEHFLVRDKRGRRVISLGVWANATTIASIRQGVEAERDTPAYAKKQAAAARRRDEVQTEYVEDFGGAVRSFLNFDRRYTELAEWMTRQVTQHATPVGSGTVARTKRIPIERRAEAAVIAWMRHQTTAYDDMKIARQKGKRREVRRELAAQSKRLLTRYRQGEVQDASCPLAAAWMARG